MQVVGVDIIGPLPGSEAGNLYVLVASDSFTKWVDVYATPNQEAFTVASDKMLYRFSPWHLNNSIQIMDGNLSLTS